eukprot:TRINITY_DN1804_c0_g1_i8.p2 TRINITY_DN1804_c0_g1~~TRINITY_DN1804_c0_g1_i8.p2  ORF type:complete len:192 (-),score=36.39 TRINITY_DN1804_c0_g1_i8:280-855(-)
MMLFCFHAFAQVKVDFHHWNKKFQSYFYSSSKYLVHDEENFCRTGDKVVIKSCPKVSQRKYYHIRNVVKMFPRNDYYEKPVPQRDEAVEKEFRKIFQGFLKAEEAKGARRTIKEETEIRLKLKARALGRAINNLKKLQAQKNKAQKKADAQKKKEEALKASQAGGGQEIGTTSGSQTHQELQEKVGALFLG